MHALGYSVVQGVSTQFSIDTKSRGHLSNRFSASVSLDQFIYIAQAQRVMTTHLWYFKRHSCHAQLIDRSSPCQGTSIDIPNHAVDKRGFLAREVADQF
jgi:hypothetical protein